MYCSTKSYTNLLASIVDMQQSAPLNTMHANQILSYAMQAQRCCDIVMHVHDEMVIEADYRMSTKVLCEQMSRTPPWAEGLLLHADGYDCPFYKKD